MWGLSRGSSGVPPRTSRLGSPECGARSAEKDHSEAGLSAQSLEVPGDQVQSVEAEVALGSGLQRTGLFGGRQAGGNCDDGHYPAAECGEDQRVHHAGGIPADHPGHVALKERHPPPVGQVREGTPAPSDSHEGGHAPEFRKEVRLYRHALCGSAEHQGLRHGHRGGGGQRDHSPHGQRTQDPAGGSGSTPSHSLR